MRTSTFYLGVALILFGQLLTSIISGLSNEVIPASLIIFATAFLLFIAFRVNNSITYFPKVNKQDALFVLLLGSFYLSAYKYGHGSSSTTKVFGTFYLILLPWLMLFLLSLSIKTVDINKLANITRKLALITIPIALLMFLLGYTSSVPNSHKITIIGVTNTIWLGRYLGLFIVILIMTSNKKNIISTIVFILMAIFLLKLSGARGPIVAMLAAIIFMKFKVKPLYAVLGLISLIFLPVFINLSNISEFLLSRDDFSNYSRVNLIKLSIELIKNYPITGIGFGNFGSYSHAFDDSINFYPHNILAEVFVECGLFSFVLIIMVIKNTFYLGENNHFLLTIFVYLFVNSLFSGDITGNSILFTSMFLIRLLSDKKIINDTFTV